MSELNGLTATIGFPCGATIPWQTTMSLLAAVRVATKRGIDLQVQTIAMNSDVCDARNAVLTQFLKTPSSRLFWIDSDIDFNPSDFLRMLELSTRYPIVCGVYPMKNEQKRIVLNGVGDGVTINKEGLVKVDSLGIGFTIVQREVLEKWVATKKSCFHVTANQDIVHAFSQSEKGGEDITFFNEVRALGYDVWIDPTIELGHVGPYVYKQDIVAQLGLSHLFKKPE